MAQTGFPSLSLDAIKELCGGPYLLRLARSYLTSQRVKEVQHHPYVSMFNYHTGRRQSPLNMFGHVFDQQVVTANWYGIWPGCQTPNTKVWEPVRLLTLPKLSSRYKSACDHTIVIAYVPSHLPVQHPTTGFKTQGLHRIKMFICGPR